MLAEARDSSVTLEVLTPAYAAPEMFRHSAPSPAADVYALCATLYAIMRGQAAALARRPQPEPDHADGPVHRADSRTCRMCRAAYLELLRAGHGQRGGAPAVGRGDARPARRRCDLDPVAGPVSAAPVSGAPVSGGPSDRPPSTSRAPGRRTAPSPGTSTPTEPRPAAPGRRRWWWRRPSARRRLLAAGGLARLAGRRPAATMPDHGRHGTPTPSPSTAERQHALPGCLIPLRGRVAAARPAAECSGPVSPGARRGPRGPGVLHRAAHLGGVRDRRAARVGDVGGPRDGRERADRTAGVRDDELHVGDAADEHAGRGSSRCSRRAAAAFETGDRTFRCLAGKRATTPSPSRPSCR